MSGPLAASVWNRQIYHWSKFGPPLIPALDDVSNYQHVIAEWATRHGPARLLLWGVTPQLTAMAVPALKDYVAVDRSLTMIENFGPGLRQAKVR
ncbi:MAG: hypothetical protein ABI882_11955, partial [Acidobacteriota bacterium]